MSRTSSHQGFLLVSLPEHPNVFFWRKQCEVCCGQTSAASCSVINDLIKTSNEETWYQTQPKCPKIIPLLSSSFLSQGWVITQPTLAQMRFPVDHSGIWVRLTVAGSKQLHREGGKEGKTAQQPKLGQILEMHQGKILPWLLF